MNFRVKVLLVFVSVAMLLCALPSVVFAEGTGSVADSVSDWSAVGSAYYDDTSDHFVLTPNEDYVAGAIWYNRPIHDDFSFEMDYYSGANDGADGLAMVFYATNEYTMTTGGAIGYVGCKGYIVEMDTHYNYDYDPEENHIALKKDPYAYVEHIASAPLSESEDGQWHHLKVEVIEGQCSVYVDGTLKFTQAVEKTGYNRLGITSSTGGSFSLHAVKNINVNAFGDEVQLAVEAFPSKLQYVVGDTLNTEGLVLNLDGQLITTGYTCEPTVFSQGGEQAVTVRYGAYETSFNVYVTCAGEEHSSTDDWLYDEASHWKICTDCQLELSRSEHSMGDWVITKEATEAEVGCKEKSCACGYTLTEEIPKKAGTPDISDPPQDTTENDPVNPSDSSNTNTSLLNGLKSLPKQTVVIASAVVGIVLLIVVAVIIKSRL